MSASADRPPQGDPRRDLDDLPDRPLTVPLLIRGSFDNGLFVACCVVALIFSGIGTLMWRERDLSAAFVVFGIAAAAALPALIMALWLRRQREWLEVTLTGFVLSRQGRRRVYSDSQLVGLAHHVTCGPEGKVKHRLVLEVAADETERIDCHYTVTNAQPDPLAGFVARLVNALAAKAERDLQNGSTFRGKGWSLDARGLRKGRETHPLDQVSWAGFYDRHLCLWRGDEERPFLRLPEESRNVLPLGELLRQRVRRRPDHDTPSPGLPLGRLLLERRSAGFYFGVGVAVAGGLGVLLCLGMAMRKWLPHERPPLYAFAVAFACGSGIGGVIAYSGRFGWLRFHERGVSQTGRMGDRRLLYTEIGELYWKQGQVLVIKPLPGLGCPPIRFRTVAGRFDSELADMRDLACKPLARRWAEQIERGPLTWTARLRFLPGGLEYRPMGLLGLGEPVSVPYDCVNFRVEGDQFLLFLGDGKRPACKERVDGANFFVGLVVLSEICRSWQAQALPDPGELAPRAHSPADERVKRGRDEGMRPGREAQA
jgi:hypothetical protein